MPAGDLGVGDTVPDTEVHAVQQPQEAESVLPAPQSLLLQGLWDLAPDCHLSTPTPLLPPGSFPSFLPHLLLPLISPSVSPSGR